jgi:hypothetical protein
LSDGSLLNRYWDDRPEPRPESYREDYTLAQRIPEAQRPQLYRNLRAAAESGWDFSSRWMRDPSDLLSLETTELVPVDLNSLLYHAERTIAALRRVRGGAGDAEVAARYASAAEARRRALLAAAYDSASGFFYDVRWRTGERVTGPSDDGCRHAPLLRARHAEQGRAVAARLGREFLAPGGFVTTLVKSGQQWDAPNGWPPLQWMGVQAARAYGREDIANDARTRWLALNRRTYLVTGKMTEKYDVTDMTKRAGGGEYPAQDGFGWTNGVARAMAAQEARSAHQSPHGRDARSRHGHSRLDVATERARQLDHVGAPRVERRHRRERAQPSVRARRRAARPRAAEQVARRVARCAEGAVARRDRDAGARRGREVGHHEHGARAVAPENAATAGSLDWRARKSPAPSARLDARRWISRR